MGKHGRSLPWTLIAFILISFVWSEDAKSRKVYTVSGERHGVSFFPLVDYAETRPKKAGEMDFEHYHPYEEVLFFLKKWEKECPELVDLYSVGKSFGGRDIWQITITNKSTGKDTDKPAMFLEGNRHSGEVEIGGYNPKFFRQNPPAAHLEEWARKQAMFNLLLAKSLPQVKIASAEAKDVKKEANTYELVCVFTNEGFLPTALEIAKRVKVVRPDSAEILLSDGIELVSGKERVDLGYLKSKEKREVRWKVKIQEAAKGDVEIMIHSTRGGVDKKTVSLKGRK